MLIAFEGRDFQSRRAFIQCMSNELSMSPKQLERRIRANGWRNLDATIEQARREPVIQGLIQQPDPPAVKPSLWNIGDAALLACGPPSISGRVNGSTQKIFHFVEYLRANGRHYAHNTVRTLRDISYIFPPESRDPSLSWVIHRTLRTPERFERFIESTAPEQRTLDQARAFRAQERQLRQLRATLVNLIRARHTNAVPVTYKGQHFPTRAAFITHLAAELKIRSTAIGPALYQHNWDIDAAIKALKANPPPPPRTAVLTYRGQSYPSKQAFGRFLEGRGFDRQQVSDILHGVGGGDMNTVERYCAAFNLMHLLDPPPPAPEPAPEPPEPPAPPLAEGTAQCTVLIPERAQASVQLMAQILMAQPHLTVALRDPVSGKYITFDS